MPTDVVHDTVVGKNHTESGRRFLERFELIRHPVEPLADLGFCLVRHGRADIVHHQPPDAAARHGSKDDSN